MKFKMFQNNIFLKIFIRNKKWYNFSVSLKEYAFKLLRDSIKEFNFIKENDSKNINNDVLLLLYLIDDEEMKTLNYKFRKKNKPTNVLSLKNEDPLFLGEIFLSYTYLRRKLKNNSLNMLCGFFSEEFFKNNLKIYSHEKFLIYCYWAITHGVLHLLGYDHKTNEQRRLMQTKEKFFLKNLINNQLIY